MKAVSYNQRNGNTERPCAQEPHRALHSIISTRKSSLKLPDSTDAVL